MSELWGASRKNVKQLGRFAQEWLNLGASRKNGHNLALAPRMPIPPSMSDFSDHSCAKRQLC